MTANDDTVASDSFARGTALGDSLRRHWIPVLPADVLERQQARRVRLFGEDLVCFRDRSGAYGLLGARCPHRGVSLEWGFAAEVGLRCAYHGWCFDSSGRCIDIPLEGSQVGDEVAIPAYPVEECGGVLFAYLGDGVPPALPFEGLALERRLRQIRFGVVEESWSSPPTGKFAADPEAWGSLGENPFLDLEEGHPSVVSMRVPLEESRTLLLEYLFWEVPIIATADWVVDSSEEDLLPGEVVGEPPAKERAVGPSWQLARALRAADDESGLGATEVLGRWLGTKPDEGREHDLHSFGRDIDAGRCADLLIGVQLPMWLRALGENDPADELSERVNGARSGGAPDALVETALECASRRLGERLSDVARQPWSAAWPYVWSPPSSLRWADARDRAYANSWRTTWRDASDALEHAGSAALLRAAMTDDGAGRDGSVVSAFRACEIAARALRWPDAWSVAWASVSTKDEGAPPADGGELECVATAIRHATLSLLGAAPKEA